MAFTSGDRTYTDGPAAAVGRQRDAAELGVRRGGREDRRRGRRERGGRAVRVGQREQLRRRGDREADRGAGDVRHDAERARDVDVARGGPGAAVPAVLVDRAAARRGVGDVEGVESGAAVAGGGEVGERVAVGEQVVGQARAGRSASPRWGSRCRPRPGGRPGCRELNSWPPWTVRALRLLAALPATVLLEPEPRVAVTMPPLPPVAQRRSPSVVVAERMIFAAPAPASSVVVSTVPLASTRPTTRGVGVGSVVVSDSPPAPVAPGAASYPVTAMKRPSAERSISPSDRDCPVAVSRWFPSAGAVGSATDWTLVPLGAVLVEEHRGSRVGERRGARRRPGRRRRRLR